MLVERVGVARASRCARARGRRPRPDRAFARGRSAPDARLAPDTARFRLFDAVARLCRLATADGPDGRGARRRACRRPVLAAAVAVPSLDISIRWDFSSSLRTATPRRPAKDSPRCSRQLVRERSTTRLRLGGLDEASVAEVIGARPAPTPRPDLCCAGPRAHRWQPAVRRGGRAAARDRGRSRRDRRARSAARFRRTSARRCCVDSRQLSDACQRRARARVGARARLPARRPRPCSPARASTSSRRSTKPRRRRSSSTAPAASGICGSGTPSCPKPCTRRSRRCAAAASTTRPAERSRCSAARDLGPRLAELARHCCASLPVGPVDRAVTYARLAGDHAVQQLAYEEGARLFDMALQAFDGSGADALGSVERTELLLALGDAQSKGGDIAAAKATYLDAADLARRAGDARPTRAVRRMGYAGRFVWMRAGTDTRIIPLLREALDCVPEEDSEVRVSACSPGWRGPSAMSYPWKPAMSSSAKRSLSWSGSTTWATNIGIRADRSRAWPSTAPTSWSSSSSSPRARFDLRRIRQPRRA